MEWDISLWKNPLGFPGDEVEVKGALWLSAAAYCPRRELKTKKFTAYASGFVVTDVFFNHLYDVCGFAGYDQQMATIHIVYRGTRSRRNWLFNIDILEVPFPLCRNCYVHRGFWETHQSVFHETIRKVLHLCRLLPSYRIVVSGHSLGGAYATLTAAALTHERLNVTLFTFGAPRIGNDATARFLSTYLSNHFRFTHYKDPVPHLPYRRDGYMHLDHEIYEDNHGNFRLCSGFEDPKCSMQYHETNIRDHMYYLGLYMHCDAVSNDD